MGIIVTYLLYPNPSAISYIPIVVVFSKVFLCCMPSQVRLARPQAIEVILIARSYMLIEVVSSI